MPKQPFKRSLHIVDISASHNSLSGCFASTDVGYAGALHCIKTQYDVGLYIHNYIYEASDIALNENL